MYKFTSVRQPKSTVEVTAQIPVDEVKKAYEETLVKVIADFEAPGFRKGHAPREYVESQINKIQMANTIVQNLAPKVYEAAVKELSLKPITSPKIGVKSPKQLVDILNFNTELEMVIMVAEIPSVNLKNYKDGLKGELAKEKIWVPGKDGEDQKPEETSPEQKERDRFVKTIDFLLKETDVELADLLIENETNHILAQSLDEIKKLGLTLDQYLANTGKTAETLKQNARMQAQNTLKLEFVLNEIARTENIKVEQKEIDEMIAKSTSEEQKKAMRENSYTLAKILLRQKTLDFLKTLV